MLKAEAVDEEKGCDGGEVEVRWWVMKNLAF